MRGSTSRSPAWSTSVVPTSVTPSHGKAKTGRPSAGWMTFTAWATGNRQAGKTRCEPRSGRIRGSAPSRPRNWSAHAPVALTVAVAWTSTARPASSASRIRAPITRACAVPQHVLRHGVRQDRRARGDRVHGHPERQARIVRLRVGVPEAAGEAGGAEARRQQLQLRATHATVRAPAGEGVVHLEAGRVRPAARRRPPVGRQQEAQLVHEPRSGLQESFALADGVAHDADLVLAEIPQAAMHELRRAGARTPREVALLHEDDAEACARRAAGDARAADPTAHHEHVPRPRQPLPRVVAPPRPEHVDRERDHDASPRRTPGCIRPAGSNRRATSARTAIPRAPFSAGRYAAWSVPTPCWWLMVPPRRTIASDASVLRRRQRPSVTSGSAASLNRNVV